ncbi:fumarylacetoacetate hydrolase family protein [Dactylosporangium sp. CA-092794]|uniref:fumarylacetoacetate hydrolase family protein n=1 Tax=Dactylosporangium sp. CA-092794 TaxID=3239929 RepID=UPI003D8F080E
MSTAYTQPWSLISYRDGDAASAAVLLRDGTVVAPPELKQWDTMLDLLDDWEAAEPVLRQLRFEGAPSVAAEELLAPLRYPRKLICAGVNYRRHIREMGAEVPAEGWRPFFFLKPPTTTIVGPDDPIVVHDPELARYDWEAELAVVIGRGGRAIPAADALGHVAAYAVANDVTARARHERTVVPGAPFRYDWVASKAIDSSFPMGPGLTPAFFVPEPQDLRMQLWVNGELQQDETTGDMICTVAELIAEASQVMTLQPGDVIATGTPSGVGAPRGRYLRHGDVVRVAIDGLGAIQNTVYEPGAEA